MTLNIYRQRPFFSNFTQDYELKKSSIQIKERINDQLKKLFLNSFAEFASKKYIQVTADEEVQKILKNRGLIFLKRYHNRQKGLQDAEQKARLLENIYCHRRLNSFFSLYRKSKFKRQHSQITSNILGKIDLIQIVNQNEDPLNFEQKESTENQSIKRQAYGPKVNTSLLNLILENFIEEYSQQYDYALSQQEFDDFLHSLKTKCIERIINTYRKTTVFQALSFHKKAQQLINCNKNSHKVEFLCQLELHQQLQQKRQQLRVTLNKHSCEKIMLRLVIYSQQQRQLSKLRQFKVISKTLKRGALNWSRKRLNERKICNFKKNIAEEWRKAQLCRLVFKSFKIVSSIQFDDYSLASSKKSANDEKSDADNDTNQAQQINAPQQLKQDETLNQFRSQEPEQYEDEYESLKYSKAKHQLSRIVNVISKGLSPKSIDIYKRNVDSQSNRPTITKFKTQSDPREQILVQQKDHEDRQKLREKKILMVQKLTANKNKRCLNSLKLYYEEEKSRKKSLVCLEQKYYDLRLFIRQSQASQTINILLRETEIKAKTKILEEILTSRECKRISEAIDCHKQFLFVKKKIFGFKQFLFLAHASSFIGKLNVNTKGFTHHQKITMLNKTRAQNQLAEVFGKIKKIYQLKANSLTVKQQIFKKRGQQFMALLQSQINLKLQIPQKKQESEEGEQNYSQEYYRQEGVSEKSASKLFIPHEQTEQYAQSTLEKQNTSQDIFNYLYTPEEQKDNIQYHQSPQNDIDSQNHEDLQQQQLQEQYEGEQWLTRQLQNNQLKRLINFSGYQRFFKLFKSMPMNKQPFSEEIKGHEHNSSDESDEVDEERGKMAELILKKRAIHSIIAMIEAKQQQKIKCEEQQEIVKFTRAKHQQAILKNAFSGLFCLIEDKWSTKTKKLCFTGWLNYIKQKKMLKTYLELEGKEETTKLTYFPQTLEEKQKFQSLRSYD